MLYFELPDSPNTRKLNIIFFQVMRQNPEWFVDNLVVEAVYGCPSVCIWNGGCVNFKQERLSSIEIKKIFDDYNDLGISYRLTFTNRLLEKKHLNDALGNEILQIGHSSMNAVLVANDIIKEYVTQNYSKYEIIQSVCRVYATDEEINANSKSTMLCLPIRYNNQWDKLSKLENHNNLMVITNEFCPRSNCPYFKKHYESDNKYTLGLVPDSMECVYKSLGKELIEKNEPLPHHIHQGYYRFYEKMGITHFKINGRGRSSSRLLPEYARLLVKDDWKEAFCQKIIAELSRF